MIRNTVPFIVLFLAVSCGRTHIVNEVRALDHYPSASGIEYYDNHIYVIGDDAGYMLVLDTQLVTTDSIELYHQTQKRLSKETKPDLEAIAMFGWRDRRQMILLGSGSVLGYREVAWLIDPTTYKRDTVRVDTFYRRIIHHGIREINLEGACSIPGAMLLSNRGHLGYRRNYLIMTEQGFWKKQSTAPISLILIGRQRDTSVFNGVSGLAYAAKSDRLVMSVSTEKTSSVYEDGEIGKSYLWIVKNISSKKRWKSLSPDQIVDLDQIDPRFRGQKIESVCVIRETKHFLHLVLAADNDKGSSTLFKLMVEKM